MKFCNSTSTAVGGKGTRRIHLQTFYTPFQDYLPNCYNCENDNTAFSGPPHVLLLLLLRVLQCSLQGFLSNCELIGWALTYINLCLNNHN
uniref:Uncharacterized protein n=1 Tax=Octopus bimaculoides TaxID=37653 RepID=A0A0L8GLV4_OCTBM